MPLHRFQTILIVICAAAAASAQSSTPPIKMGLWETTVSSQMSGFTLPPDVVAKLKAMGRPVPGGPHTVVTQGCLTSEEWQQQMGKMNQPANGDCQTTRHLSEAGKFSFDMSCKTPQGAVTTGHWEMQVIDAEHGHGSGHMQSSAAGSNGHAFAMSMTMDSHFLSADCGGVKPGGGKIIRQE